MPVHVVDSVLRIVFNDEDLHRFPKLAVAQRIDNQANGVVVIGYHRFRGRGSGGSALCMIARQLQYHEIRHRVPLLQFGNEDLRAHHVGDVGGVRGEILGQESCSWAQWEP